MLQPGGQHRQHPCHVLHPRIRFMHRTQERHGDKLGALHRETNLGTTIHADHREAFARSRTRRRRAGRTGANHQYIYG